MKRAFTAVVILLYFPIIAVASESIRQPQADGTGAETITSTTSGGNQCLDINVATGTVGLETTVTADIDSIEVNTDPLTSYEQLVEVAVAGSATDTIACTATSSVFILAVNSSDVTYYAYDNDANSAPRMKLNANEKFVSPEGIKVSVKTLNLYNPGTATATFFLECWR